MTRALEYRAARTGARLSDLKIGDQLYLERVPKDDGSGEHWLLPTRRTHFNIIKPFITGFCTSAGPAAATGGRSARRPGPSSRTIAAATTRRLESDSALTIALSRNLTRNVQAR
jgi:hypothetical protein